MKLIRLGVNSSCPLFHVYNWLLTYHLPREGYPVKIRAIYNLLIG